MPEQPSPDAALIALRQTADRYCRQCDDGGPEAEPAYRRMMDAMRTALPLRPTTLPGALAALEWARCEFVAGLDGETPDFVETFTLGMLDGALDALRRAVADGAA